MRYSKNIIILFYILEICKNLLCKLKAILYDTKRHKIHLKIIKFGEITIRMINKVKLNQELQTHILINLLILKQLTAV